MAKTKAKRLRPFKPDPLRDAVDDIARVARIMDHDGLRRTASVFMRRNQAPYDFTITSDLVLLQAAVVNLARRLESLEPPQPCETCGHVQARG